MLKLAFFITLMSAVVFVQKSRNWRDIVPLVTKRAEVEALLGHPTRGSGFILSYDTQDERITIWYGGAKPAKDDLCKWNVNADTVFSFIVAPKKKQLLSQLGLNLTEFEKQKDREIEGVFYYFNKKDGITVLTRTVECEETVEGVHYSPRLIDRQKYCPD
jgi:hypothetical protein